jgi:hypothetical protein
MTTKTLISLLIICIIQITTASSNAQTPLWQGKGRIAISSDGNEHDHDDWAATPLSLALLAAAGLQDNLVIYTYSDHIWGSNQSHTTSASGLNSYLHMRESALGGQKWFGFDKTKFVCAVDNAEVAYTALRDVINESTADNPLIIIAAGPMQVVGEAINRADQNKRQFVSLVSHSNWNNMHSDKPGKNYWDVHSGWTFQEIKDSFSGDAGGNLKCIQITDQNGGSDYDGFNAPIEKFDWIKNSEARNNPAYKPGAWDWLYTRQETCIKENGKNFDPSDAGMIVYLLTGIEKTEPEMVKKIMENPAKK